jgi:hypothetical protein
LWLVSLGALGFAAEVQAQGATASVAVEPAGYATYPIPSQAVGADYYLSESTSLGVNFARGTSERLMAEYAAELALLRFKFHFGTTMHLSLGAGYRSLGYTQTVRTATGDADAETEMQVVVAETSFGNKIALGPVLVGCDWLGIAVPVSRIKLKNEFPDDIVVADEAAANKDGAAAVEMKPTLQFLRVYLGAVF